MKNTSVAICTYHRSFEGDGNKNIIEFKNQGFDNFFVLFDNQNGLSSEEVSAKYDNSPISIYNNEDFAKYGFKYERLDHFVWALRLHSLAKTSAFFLFALASIVLISLTT